MYDNFIAMIEYAAKRMKKIFVQAFFLKISQEKFALWNIDFRIVQA